MREFAIGLCGMGLFLIVWGVGCYVAVDVFNVQGSLLMLFGAVTFMLADTFKQILTGILKSY